MPEYELIPIEPEYELVPIEAQKQWPQTMLDDFNKGKKTTEVKSEPVDRSKAMKESIGAGMVEGALSGASGMVSWIPSGLSKAAGLVSGQLEGGSELGNYLQEQLTYQPKSKIGKEIASYISKPFELISEGSQKAADYVFDKTEGMSPEARAALAAGTLTAGESIPFVAPAALHGGIKKVGGKLARDLSVLETVKEPALKPVKIPEEVKRIETKEYVLEPVSRIAPERSTPAQKTPSETPPSVASAEPQETSGQVSHVAPERTITTEELGVKPEMKPEGKGEAVTQNELQEFLQSDPEKAVVDFYKKANEQATEKAIKDFSKTNDEAVNAQNREEMKRTAELVKNPPIPEKIYRGISLDELEYIKKTGNIKSSGIGNFDYENAEGLTMYSGSPREALAYTEGFTLQGREPTDIKPNYVIEVLSTPEMGRNSVRQIKTNKAVPAKNITRIIEIRPDGKYAEFKSIDDALNRLQKPSTPTAPSPDKPTSPNALTTEIISKEGKGKDEIEARKIENELNAESGEKEGTTLYSGIDPTAIKGLGKSIKAEWDALESTSPIAKTLGERLRKTGRGLREAFNEPEYELKADPTGKGKEIFKTLATAEERKNAFLPRLNEFIRQTKGIKPGSIESERVGMALDGKMKPTELTAREGKAYTHLKNEFDFLIKEYARSLAGDETTYQRALKKASNKHEAKVKIEDLNEGQKAVYQALSSDAAKIRAGKSLKELSGDAKKDYWDVRQQMSDMLHAEWLKTLPEPEAAAYNVLSRKIKEYLPHLFDKEDLADMFRAEIATITKKLENATDKGAITSYKTKLNELNEALVKTQGGYLVTYDQLPSNIRMRFFETRKGTKGYSYDAIKAYQAYLSALAKKMYDEQAVRKVKELYTEMSPEYKPYTKDLVRHYMGWDRNSLDWLAGTITSFEWIRTLGLNPRSAIVNLTQRLNTAVYAGEKWAAKAEKMMLLEREKANAVFEKSGIAREVPTVLAEGVMPEGMEKIRAVVGYMFQRVELGNRKHAYLSGYLKALSEGKTEAQAMKQGIKTVHKTQFRYGKLGMPKVLRHPVGRVLLQFSSYPLKQARFLYELMKKDPVALMKYIAYAEGINYGVKELLDTDLTNALGIGITWGEAWKAVNDFVGGDMYGAVRHGKQAVQPGAGMLPSGLGPAAQGVVNIKDKIKEGKGFKQFVREVEPVMLRRISQAYDAVKDEKNGMYPVKDSNGHVMYYLSGRQILQRTIGPRTATEGKSYLDFEAKTALEKERLEILRDMTNSIIEGDKDRVKMLVKKYKVFPSDKMIENELLNRKMTKQEQNKFGVKEQYQMQREGRLY